MDEKGDEAEPGNHAEVADKPAAKVSLKEKLEVYKAKSVGVQKVKNVKEKAKAKVEVI